MHFTVTISRARNVHTTNILVCPLPVETATPPLPPRNCFQFRKHIMGKALSRLATIFEKSVSIVQAVSNIHARTNAAGVQSKFGREINLLVTVSNDMTPYYHTSSISFRNCISRTEYWKRWRRRSLFTVIALFNKCSSAQSLLVVA